MFISTAGHIEVHVPVVDDGVRGVLDQDPEAGCDVGREGVGGDVACGGEKDCCWKEKEKWE